MIRCTHKPRGRPATPQRSPAFHLTHFVTRTTELGPSGVHSYYCALKFRNLRKSSDVGSSFGFRISGLRIWLLCRPVSIRGCTKLFALDRLTEKSPVYPDVASGDEAAGFLTGEKYRGADQLTCLSEALHRRMPENRLCAGGGRSIRIE